MSILFAQNERLNQIKNQATYFWDAENIYIFILNWLQI